VEGPTLVEIEDAAEASDASGTKVVEKFSIERETALVRTGIGADSSKTA